MITADQIKPERLRPLKRSEYDRLVSAGVFEGERIELLEGAIVQMSPRDAEHSWVIQILGKRLTLGAGDRGMVRIQLPLAISPRSEPEPDLAVVPPGDYGHAHPRKAWLVVEVSRDSLRKDRNLKGRIYAAARIPEYWIWNLMDRVVEVHSEPGPGGYRSKDVVGMDGELTLERLPDLRIPVGDVMPAGR